MSKHQILTRDEFSGYHFSKRTLQHIEIYRKSKGLKKIDMKILDWGCGRGRDVLWLREKGYNAFGIDVDAEPIENGLPLFRELGHSTDCLGLLKKNGSAEFNDGFFDFTFSNQVFEHIPDLDGVAVELYRITRNQGWGFHTYPANKEIYEGHLYMPFVHWLPKNFLRKFAILFFVLIHPRAHWSDLENASAGKKVRVYYEYSINKTFYRNTRRVLGIFRKQGFKSGFDTVNHPGIVKHSVLKIILKLPMGKYFLSFLLNTFKIQELLIEKNEK